VEGPSTVAARACRAIAQSARELGRIIARKHGLGADRSGHTAPEIRAKGTADAVPGNVGRWEFPRPHARGFEFPQTAWSCAALSARATAATRAARSASSHASASGRTGGGRQRRRIEAQFTSLRYFALDGTDHACHERLGRIVSRTNVA
jgi:hypothetical protein